jgi:acyl-coenzyme A synthetase/AMP-(fatty) acid ligase
MHRLSGKEIEELLLGCPCEVLVVGVEFSDVVGSLHLPSLGIKSVVWVGEWTFSPDEQLRAEEGMHAEGVENICYNKVSTPTPETSLFEPPPMPKDESMQGVQLFFTSGTTGKPKQIVHSAKNIYYWSVYSLSTLDLHSDDHHCALHSMTMSHIADNAFVWSLTLIGGRHAFMSCSMGDVSGFLQTLSEEEVTIAKAAPTLISIACGFSSKAFSKYNLSQIRWIWSAGAALADDLRIRAEERFGCDIWRGYGYGVFDRL